MLFRNFLLIALYLLVMLPVSAEDEIDSSSGPVRVSPDTSETVHEFPIDEETGMIDWYAYLAPPDGQGASFGFITMLYPPDPAALSNTPDILLDGAWYPPIPFSSGFTPPTDGSQLSTTGWWYLEDPSGMLARRDMDISMGNSTWKSSTWFMGGDKVFHIEQNWTEGYFGDAAYLPDEWTGSGIDYFLRSIWFRGILGGERMEALLNICGAVQVGRDVVAGTRNSMIIYRIPAIEIDRQNGRGSLLVWLTFGRWDLVRTRVHTVYATEVTDYVNRSGDISLDPMVFYSNFLPEDIYWSIDNYLLSHETPFWNFINEEITYMSPENQVHDGSGTSFADIGSQ